MEREEGIVAIRSREDAASFMRPTESKPRAVGILGEEAANIVSSLCERAGSTGETLSAYDLIFVDCSGVPGDLLCDFLVNVVGFVPSLVLDNVAPTCRAFAEAGERIVGCNRIFVRFSGRPDDEVVRDFLAVARNSGIENIEWGQRHKIYSSSEQRGLESPEDAAKKPGDEGLFREENVQAVWGSSAVPVVLPSRIDEREMIRVMRDVVATINLARQASRYSPSLSEELGAVLADFEHTEEDGEGEMDGRAFYMLMRTKMQAVIDFTRRAVSHV